MLLGVLWLLLRWLFALFVLVSKLGELGLKPKTRFVALQVYIWIARIYAYFLNMVMVVLLTFSLVVDVELLPLGFVGVIRCEDVLKIVSCGLGSLVLLSLLNSV